MENAEVLDALGNEARAELSAIRQALKRITDGIYGLCVDCEEPIEPAPRPWPRTDSLPLRGPDEPRPHPPPG